jgi:hypothetical protein
MIDSTRILTLVFLSAISVSVRASPVYADPIIIFNTAVDSNGDVLPRRTVDPHFQLASSPKGPAPAYVLDSTFCRGHYGPWLADNKHSKWIGPKANERHYLKAGKFDYRTTFDLTGQDPNTAILKGKWTSDNNATLYLNGVDTGNTTPTGGYGSFSHFSVTSGFIAGINTLDFVVRNIRGRNVPNNPTGLRVEFTQATANGDGSETVPSDRP